MPKSNYAKMTTLSFFCRPIDTPLTRPNQLHLALFATNPGDIGSGTEASYTGYQRQGVDFTQPEASGGTASTKNSNVITFPVVSGTIATPTIAFAGLYSEASGGSLIYYGPLAATYQLSQGVQPIVAINSLTIFET